MDLNSDTVQARHLKFGMAIAPIVKLYILFSYVQNIHDVKNYAN